jgi:CRISPR-associated protein Cmr6
MAISSIMRSVEASPQVNIPSYLRLKLIELVMSSGQTGRGGKASSLKDELNQLNRTLMMELVNAYKCENVRDILANVTKHMDYVAKSLEELGYEVVFRGDMALMSRLAINLRHPYTEPLEPGISWDPYWNLPYIPSSSLKGAIRAIAENTKSPCTKAFGDTEESSTIVILDSYPTYCPSGKSLLTLDIINPHYREVEGEISEVESSPTPLTMLTVSTGVAFRVIVLVARNRLTTRCSKASGNHVYVGKNCEEACTTDDLRKIVMQALKEGIGAKTALGYGAFGVIIR